jgi:secreted trypsin-like serine protease
MALSAVLLPAAFGASGTGQPAAGEAVLGGSPAEPGTFPSLAFVLDVKGQLADQCTGTVIAPNLVLTAAHCAENMQTGALAPASAFQVVTGTVDWRASSRTLSSVSRVILYPRFARRVDDGDAALLVLSTPTTVPAITLATPVNSHWLHAGSSATIAGWGKTHYQQSVPTKRLQQAATGVQTSTWCERHAVLFDPKNEICTIDPPSYRTGGCEGDSGGPLIAVDPTDGEPVEVGLTIRAQYTCATRYPTVFTRVSAIYTWIHRWITALTPPAAPPVTTTTTTTTTTTATAPAAP